jgi:hypothetical protein
VDNVTSQYIHPKQLLLFASQLDTMSRQSKFTVPPPASKLAHYRTLSPLAGVRVSPIQLGAGSIGDKWHELGMGSMDKGSSFKLLDAYFDLGVCQNFPFLRSTSDPVKKGNFIDTANN